jgi:uncharacterized membrane protein YgcG
MREEPQPGERRGLTGADSDSELERRFRWALALYVVLAALAWFTMGEGTVIVLGRPVEMRLVPLVVIGAMALRTVLARQAEKIRRQSGDGGGI